MPFGLKNIEATYQRAMVTHFHGMMHKEIKVYISDMIAKSQERESHLVNPKKLFKWLRNYQLKLFGFIVSSRVIEVDLAKIKAIQDMLVPRT